MSVPEIARRFINGAWVTGVAQDGGGGGSQSYISMFIQGSTYGGLGGPYPAIDTDPANSSTFVHPTITLGAGTGFSVRVVNKASVSIIADLIFEVLSPDGANVLTRSSDTLTFSPGDDLTVDFPYGNSAVGTDLSWDAGSKEIRSTAGGQFSAFAIIQPRPV